LNRGKRWEKGLQYYGLNSEDQTRVTPGKNSLKRVLRKASCIQKKIWTVAEKEHVGEQRRRQRNRAELGEMAKESANRIKP